MHQKRPWFLGLVGRVSALIALGVSFFHGAFAATVPEVVEKDPRILIWVGGFVVALLVFVAIASRALPKGPPNDDDGAFPIPLDLDRD